jgi:hypothetical protein
MRKYFIEGSPATFDDAEDYFVAYSGFTRDDAREIFRNESPEFINENCSEIEILEEGV